MIVTLLDNVKNLINAQEVTELHQWLPSSLATALYIQYWLLTVYMGLMCLYSPSHVIQVKSEVL